MSIARTLTVAAFSIVLLTMGGCNYLGPAYYLASPEPEIDAEYLLEDRPTVVFVDESANELGGMANQQIVGKTISQALLDEEVVTVVYEPRAANAVARQERHGEPMALGDIGRAVGADQIICVQVLQFQPFPTYGQTRPIAQLRVKVLDIPHRLRLYPTDDELWRHLTVTLPQMPEEVGNASKRRELESMLAREIGINVARLFHDYNPRPLGRNLN